MRNRLILMVLLFSFFCTDPGVSSKTPLKFANNWSSGDPSKILDSLNGLILESKVSIECAFSDLDAGYTLDLQSRTNLVQKSIRAVAKNIINKRNEGVQVTIIFDTDKKCVSNGSLLFQYPQFFLNDTFENIKFKEMIQDCNLISTNIPFATLQNVKQEGLHENSELFFVNSNGNMSDNFCVFDKKTIWFSLSSLIDSISSRQVISFQLEAIGTPIIEEFTKEIEMLKNNLTGGFKKPYHNMKDYNLYDSTWHILRGPQDSPLKYLSGLIDLSASLTMYSSGFDFDLKNTVVTSLINLVNSTSELDILFADTGIFSETSLFQGFFNKNNYCLNYPDFCANHLTYFNLKPGVDRQHVFLLQDIYGNKKTVLYNGTLNLANEKNDDTFLIEIESGIIYDELLSNLNELSNKANSIGNTLQFSSLPLPGDITITEIIWMGSIDNQRNAHTSDEAIELYNTTDHNVDISGIILACTNSLNGDIANHFFSIPNGVILMPRQYFSIASRQNGAFVNANLIVPDVSIGNTTRECLLVDNRNQAISYYPINSVNGHYNDSRLNGIILDQILNYTQDSWNLYSSHFFSKTGLNTIKYNIEGEGARSMEKISPLADGKNLKNWHMNTFTPLQNRSSADYIFHTFTSLGFENSPSTEPSDGSVVVNEIHWMGSYDISGTSNASDEFVEFFNRSLVSKNIGGWIFGCSTDMVGATGKPLFAIPYGVEIKPGQYLVVQKIGSIAFSNIDYTLDFTLNNTITQCLLTDGNFTETNFQGSDSNADGILSGHYDSPLFVGSVADFASDRSSSFVTLGLGINNATTRIRRSCERIDASMPGNIPTNWKSNTIINPLLNMGLYPNFRANTFATPGMPNSN